MTKTKVLCLQELASIQQIYILIKQHLPKQQFSHTYLDGCRKTKATRRRSESAYIRQVNFFTAFI